MSDDLISRKAVLKELREITDEPHSIMFLMGIGAAISVIEHAETAFDKEKVIKELMKCSDDPCTLHECGVRSEYCSACMAKKAIEIVEKGGIE